MKSTTFFLLVALPALASAQCTGVWSSIFDSWCDENCNAEPPFCPNSFCQCPAAPAPATAVITEQSVGSCTSQLDMYYLELSNLYYVRVDGTTFDAQTTPVLCEQFVGPTDIEIDSDGNIIVADRASSTLYMVPAGCGDKQVITQWSMDQLIPNPTAVAIGEGGLFVSSESRVYFIEVGDDYELASSSVTSITTHPVQSMDTAPDGRLFFLERGAYINVYNPATGGVSTYTSVHQYGLPDMMAITVSECGLYISVTDSNQIWHCDDLDDGDSCEMYCTQDQDNLDASSCVNFNNPFGLTVDSECNVYTASRGNGQVVGSDTDGMTYPLVTGLIFPTDVELSAADVCASQTPTPTPEIPESNAVAISEHIPGCCDVPIDLYFIELSTLYYVQLDAFTNEPLMAPQACEYFLGPSDIEIDENQNILVADPTAGEVYMVPAGCGTKKVITSWNTDQIVDHPTALAIAQGGLYVSGNSRIFFLEVDEDYNLVSSTQTDITMYGVDSMDTATNGMLYVLERGASILMYNPADGTTTTYLNVHEHGIPDMKGIKVSHCGLYISVTDSNQVWHCDDLSDGNSCEMLCIQDQDNLDASSCVDFNNPFGLTVDCNCTLFTASRANGQVVVTESDGTSSPIVPNLYHPTDVEIYVSHDCSPPSRSSTPSPTRSPSPTASVTRSPSPTASPTASLTASPSSSLSPSPTASLTASPTSSLSASPTPTSSPSITASPSASISASPTPSESASPTPTSTPTPTASPSPTPSELYEQFLVITDYNTVCSAGSCDGVDLTMLGQMPASTRSISVEHTIKYFLDLDDSVPFHPDLHAECDIGYDPIAFPDGECSRSIDPFDYINFDNSTWVTYIDQDDVGTGFPPYVTPLEPYAVGVYPNPLEFPAISGIINCVGYNDVTFRVVIEEPRPIANDFVFGEVTMLRRDTDSPSNSQYVNMDGNNPDPRDAYKEFTCIESV